jgi:hypothetical protein
MLVPAKNAEILIGMTNSGNVKPDMLDKKKKENVKHENE